MIEAFNKFTVGPNKMIKKKCPMCDSRYVFVKTSSFRSWLNLWKKEETFSIQSFSIQCACCGISTKEEITLSRAIEGWETRVDTIDFVKVEETVLLSRIVDIISKRSKIRPDTHSLPWKSYHDENGNPYPYGDFLLSIPYLDSRINTMIKSQYLPIFTNVQTINLKGKGKVKIQDYDIDELESVLVTLCRYRHTPLSGLTGK